MIQAVIFDMDGVIIDSEPLQSQAWESIIRQYGKEPELNSAGLVHFVGFRIRENWEIIKERYEINEEIEALEEKRSQIYLMLLRKNMAPMRGFMDLIKTLKDKGLKLAIASSSHRDHVETLLDDLGIREYIDEFVSGDMVKKGKPHPDIYLEAANRLDVEPEKCVALEDSEVGVEAAKNADMKVIAVPNKYTRSMNFSDADLVLESLEDIYWEMILALI